MGLFDRLSRLLRSNINDLIAKAENPEKMLVQVIEDMRKQLAQAKQEVAVAIADLERTGEELRSARARDAAERHVLEQLEERLVLLGDEVHELAEKQEFLTRLLEAAPETRLAAEPEDEIG